MKKLICILLALIMLTGCSANRTDITAEEIIAAYESAGYCVSSGTYDETLDHGQTGYIQADHPDGGYIYFSIYESEAAAKAAKDELYHPGMTAFFSMIFGDPSWLRWEVHGNIIVEYDQAEFYDVFEMLLKEH